MFQSEAPQSDFERYRVQIIGEMRTGSHQEKVQEALDKGSDAGWQLVSAMTNNATGFFVTGVYWDTTPER
jgi:hypothetical protein